MDHRADREHRLRQEHGAAAAGRTRRAGVIDADVVTRDLQRRGAPAYGPVVAAFGPEIVQADGEIDRRALGNRVFADPAALRRLEGIVRPLVRDEIVRRIAALPQPWW